MSLLAGGIIAVLAKEIGAPIIEGILTRAIGRKGGEIAGTIIRTIATKAGTTEEGLPGLAESDPDAVKQAIAETEAEMAEVWKAGLEGQFALAETEAKSENVIQWAWRPGWMYLLAIFWIWRLIFVPLFNRSAVAPIEAIDLGTMLTLTSWFLALYMGGHTVKEFGKSIAGAVAGWRRS
ncbi:MAG: hypothetical protein K8H74_17955 [Notoacmeibacter sp.]|nr:hypothetical protein [Notoacmeibacter sp.]